MKPYGKLILEGKHWVIDDLQPHVCIKLKDVFRKIERNTVAPFKLENTPANCRDLLWFTSRYPLEAFDVDLLRLEEGAHAFDVKVAEMERILRPDYTAAPHKLKGELRPYQAQGVDLLLANKRLLVGDDLGLGKTLVAIGAFTDPRTLPAVVVVQTHLPKQWKDQIEKFTDLKVHLVKGTQPYSLPPADVYVMKYSCLGGWVDTYKDGWFRSVTFDEVQELRKHGSVKSASARILSSHAEFALGLSATPVYNYGDEIYNVLESLNPGCLGEWKDFAREWLGWDGRRVKDPQALGSFLREHYLMIRRTRAETSQYLPPVNRIVHEVGYDEQAVKSVEDLARQLAMRATTGSFTERGQAARELDLMVRHNTGVSKARYVAEYVKILLENKEPVLLAGWHRDVYDIWLKELAEFNPVMYTGTESPAQKEEAKRRFTSGETNLMIISLRSGVGLDGLQVRCSTVVFGELDWSPMIHEQVIGRVQRDGQAGQVTAIFLVSDSGSDPLIVDLCGLKSSQSHGILNPSMALPESAASDDSRLKLLAERYLATREKT